MMRLKEHKRGLGRFTRGILVAAFLSLLGVPAFSSTISNIPTEHRISSYIDELARRGLLRGFFFSEKPYSRQDVCAAIDALDREVGAGSIDLSPHESWLVERLKEEFRFLRELATSHKSGAELGAELQLSGASRESDVTWESETEDGLSEDTATESEEFLRGVGSAWIEVSMPHGLSLSHRVRVDSRISDDPGLLGRPWREETGGYVSNGYGKLKLGPLEALLGRDEFFWGPGSSGSLILSDVAPSLDMVSVTFNLGRVSAQGFFTRLDELDLRRAIFYAGDSLDAGDPAARYLSGHRIDVRVTPTFEIGLSETVVYGGPDRGFELGYLNPLNFFYAEQWNLGKNDNPFWCFDGCWWPAQRLQVYGQLLIDDYQFEHKGEKDEEPPETGFLVGAHSGDPFGLSGVTLTGEYARVNPWTYNQVLPWNRYTYGSTILGHPLGPDADAFYLRIGKWFNEDFSAELDYRFMRHGETSIDTEWPVPVSGPWGDASFPKGFPVGLASKSHRLGLLARYHPAVHFDVDGFASVEKVSDYGNEQGTELMGFEVGLRVSFRPEFLLGIGE